MLFVRALVERGTAFSLLVSGLWGTEGSSTLDGVDVDATYDFRNGDVGISTNTWDFLLRAFGVLVAIESDGGTGTSYIRVPSRNF